MERQMNIDKMIDEGRCPGIYFCTVATTGYDKQKKEHKCYLCWRRYCAENNLEIIYDEEYYTKT